MTVFVFKTKVPLKLQLVKSGQKCITCKISWSFNVELCVNDIERMLVELLNKELIKALLSKIVERQNSTPTMLTSFVVS